MLRNTRINWTIKNVPMALILAGLVLTITGTSMLNTPEINTEQVKIQPDRETARGLVNSGIGLMIFAGILFAFTNKSIRGRF